MKNQLIILIVLAAIFTACAPNSEVIPTLDIGAIQTWAVKTAIMEITVQAILHPSSTPIPAAIPPLPATPQGTAEPVSVSGGTGGSSNSTGSGSSGGTSGTPLPTRTPDVYICEYVTQNPLDKPQMTGANYDMVWTIRNTGVATWNTSEYYVKWLGGSDLSPSHTYPLPKNVVPFGTVDIIVDINIPTSPTTDLQVTRWGIVNDNGDVFCKFFHAIPSTYPPYLTLTPTN
jgi:hypothetical protein